MLVTFLVIMLLRLSQLSRTLPPFLDNHAIWMSWSHRDCYMRSFSIHLLERNTRPSQVIPSSMIVTKTKKTTKKAEILLCCYVRLFDAFFWMRDNDLSRSPRPVKDLPSSAVNLTSELAPSCHWSRTHQAISALLMSASGPPPRTQSFILFSVAACI